MAYGQAAELYRRQGDPIATGRVLTRLGNVIHRLGDPTCEEVMAEAVELLSAQPPGPELVSAITYASGRRMFTGEDAEAIAGADRAIALAAELGLPKPAFTLHMRGVARAHLGDGGGIDDLREALALGLEQGLGRETAVIHGNLCGAVSVFDGPEAGFEALGEAIAFSERRGMTEMTLQNRSGIPSFMAELGRTEEALTEVGPLADQVEAAGDMAWLILRATELHLLAVIGASDSAADPEALLVAVRGVGLPMWLAPVIGAVAELLLAQGDRTRAHAVLAELDRDPAVREVTQYELPQLLRTALALGDTELARRLIADDVPPTPAIGHARVSARAQLAEAAGEPQQAASLYADAVERWRAFGNVPELAYALLGQGRCLLSLGGADAEAPLAEAGDLFASMGYKPALAEAENLLARAVAKTA